MKKRAGKSALVMKNRVANLGVADENLGGEIRRRRGTLRQNRTSRERIAAKIGCVACDV